MNTIGYRNPRFYQARTMPRLIRPKLARPPRQQHHKRANQTNKHRPRSVKSTAPRSPRGRRQASGTRPASRPNSLCPLSRARAALPRMLSSPVSQSSESESIRPGCFWPALLTGACFSSGTSRVRAPTLKCASLAMNNPRETCRRYLHPPRLSGGHHRPITRKKPGGRWWPQRSVPLRNTLSGALQKSRTQEAEKPGEATTILEYGKDLVDQVIDGTMPLNKAYEEAQRRKKELQSDEAKLARLQNRPVLVKLMSAMLR
jgi:hypothetical protein